MKNSILTNREKEVFELFVGKNSYLDKYPLKDVKSILKDMYEYIVSKNDNVISKIGKAKMISSDNEAILRNQIEEYLKIYKN